MSNSCRTTNRTVLVAPETEIIRFWTLQQHGSSGSAPAPLLATSLLNPCKTTGRTDLAAPESWITQFWNLQQHKLSGSAPTPLLATPLLIPCRTNGPYCSVRSRIMKHSVLESPATWIIRFCPPPPFEPRLNASWTLAPLSTKVLDSPATRIIRFCAGRWGPMHGVAIRKGHLFFTLCDGGLSISNVDHYFNSKIIAYISDQ